MGLLRIDSGGCQRICDLPDDLLVKILLLIPTKDALATAILSQRWRHVWKMLPELTFKDDQGSESFGLFIDKSLQLHEAPRLFELTVELGPPCHVDVDDVTKWVEKAVNHDVDTLDFKLLGTAPPITFPMSLYTCKTLTLLYLSGNILIDVPFLASLPSLCYINLSYVQYKDDDSLARLLSSSPVLDHLVVKRNGAQDDNLTNFTVKVPTLICLSYFTDVRKETRDHVGSVVIDAPAVTVMLYSDYSWADYCCFVENMPCLDELTIRYVPNHNAKFLECISSVKRLFFTNKETMIAGCNDIKFSRLTDLFFHPEDGTDWFEPLLFFLLNSPTLKTLTINTEEHVHPPYYWTWKQSSTIPECLSSHLEIVRWKDYRGRKTERQFIAHILAKSISLKTLEISLHADCNIKTCRNELKSLLSKSSCQLLYSTPEAEWSF